MPDKRVLSIGQCAADHGALARTFRKHFNAEVVPADAGAEAAARLGQEAFDLVLVNRVLDADGSSGLAVLRALKADAKTRQVPAMLVSNHDDAQREAVAAGALPGFGKAALGQAHMLARVRPLLEA